MSIFIFSHNKQINYYHIFAESYLRLFPDAEAILFVHGEEEYNLAKTYNSYTKIIDILSSKSTLIDSEEISIVNLEKQYGETFFWEDLEIDRWFNGVDNNKIENYVNVFMKTFLAAFKKYNPKCGFGEFTRLGYRIAFRYFYLEDRPFYHFETSRYFKRFFVYDNLNWNCKEISLRQEEIIDGKHGEIPEFIKKEFHRIKGSTAVLSYSRNNENNNLSFFKTLKKFILRRVRNEPNFDNYFFKKSKKIFLNSLIGFIKRLINAWVYKYYIKIKTVKQLNNKNYAVYFLHYQPEYTVEGLGLKYFNQFELIKNISHSLPKDMELIVKEHYPMIGERSWLKYRELNKIRNVSLANHSIKGTHLIRDAKLVFTISGTVAIESVIFNKPCFTFSKYFEENKFIHPIKDIRNLNSKVVSVLKTNDFDETYGQSYLWARFMASYAGSVPVYENNYSEYLENRDNIETVINSFKNYLKKELC